MKNFISVVAFAFAFAISTTGGATSFGTDKSDLWWNPNESGWGLQLVQQADIIFATMFVYDSAGNPIWYTATLTTAGNGQYSGALMLTRGPWLGTSNFNPGLVSYRTVGQLSFTLDFVEQGRVSYSVDGVSVSKVVYRQTLKSDDYAGSYLGAYKVTAAGCFNPANNGSQIIPVTINITQGPSNLRLAASAEGFACVYVGDYRQAGQFGSTRGTYSCTDGDSGSYTLFEMNVNYSDMRGRLSAKSNFDQGCSLSGTFAALRQ